MQHRRRSPQAMIVRGGRWFRPPRPRLIARSESPPVCENYEEGKDAGYHTCDQYCDQEAKGEKSEALVASAQFVVESLATTDGGAAEIVQALCDRLKKKEVQVGKLKKKNREMKSTAAEVGDQQLRQKDAQGQCGRYRSQVHKLEADIKTRHTSPKHHDPP